MIGTVYQPPIRVSDAKDEPSEQSVGAGGGFNSYSHGCNSKTLEKAANAAA